MLGFRRHLIQVRPPQRRLGVGKIGSADLASKALQTSASLDKSGIVKAWRRPRSQR